VTTPAYPALRTILVADDAFDSRQILVRLLRQCTRATIVEARDGTTAVERFHALKPQITFLDLEMPGLAGLEVLRAIRLDDPAAFVAIVTGFGSSEAVQSAVALGVGGFVVKPYRTQRIIDVLERHRTLHDALAP
jgi:two-component system, chemotaxis family, chemotaxis protein CheY